jgi:hypothetical protein
MRFCGPSYLLHPPALRSKRCADDLWRQGPGRDPHPSGAPQRTAPDKEPPTLRTHFICLLPFGRAGDDLSSASHNNKTSIVRCQNEETKAFHTQIRHALHASYLSIFPTGDPHHPTFRRGRCVKRQPGGRPHLTDWQKRARNVSACVFVRSQQRWMIGDNSGVHPHTGRTDILNTLHARMC